MIERRQSSLYLGKYTEFRPNIIPVGFLIRKCVLRHSSADETKLPWPKVGYSKWEQEWEKLSRQRSILIGKSEYGRQTLSCKSALIGWKGRSDKTFERLRTSTRTRRHFQRKNKSTWDSGEQPNKSIWRRSEGEFHIGHIFPIKPNTGIITKSAIISMHPDMTRITSLNSLQLYFLKRKHHRQIIQNKFASLA